MAPRKPSSDPAADILKLDQQIHDLLMKRAARLAPLLASGLRPDADADELRRLLERHSGSFPLRAMLRIWREIQSAPLAAADYSVHVYSGDSEHGYWDLARAYFGSTLPFTGHATASSVIHACAENARACGLVPVPESAENGSPWWAQLAAAGEGGPRVIARLPLLMGDGGRFDYPGAYAIGTIASADAGGETSVLFFETNQELSRARLQSLLKQVGISGSIVAAGQDPSRGQKRVLLLETAGFVGAGDARIAALLASGGEAILRAVPVGAYANPLLSVAAEGTSP